MTSRVVLVTGASTGIGRAIASVLGQRRFMVFGTSRNPANAEPISGVTFLPLDVRSDASVAACVNAIVARAGRIDVLVNNAGETLRGAIEEATVEEAQALFDTNFFGVVRMTRVVLPHMRRQHGGRIVNISSIAGVIATPFIGFYAATKWALEGYSEALRHEVWPFGIRVTLVEPGWIRTDIGTHGRGVAEQIPAYEAWRRRGLSVEGESVARGSDPAVVAARVLRVIESPKPRLRYRVGASSGTARLRHILPQSWFERAVRRYFGLTARAEERRGRS